jgi:GDP-4-dehydro-6-deoxy-D-mannose reductase
MRAAITGSDGFVGRWLAADLAAAGHEVHGATRRDVDVVDAAGIGTWLRSIRPSAIFHLAAPSFAPEVAREPGAAFAVAVGGTINVLEAARTITPPPVVLIPSSSVVYGSPASADLPLRETSALRPVGPYAMSKAAQELAARSLGAHYGVPVIVGRAFNHTGPGQRPVFAVPALAARIVALHDGGPASIRAGNVDIRRDFLDVRDVVRAYRLLVEGGLDGRLPAGCVVNVCSGRSVSIRSIVDRLGAIAGRRVSIEPDEELVRGEDPLDIRGDFGLLASLTGWRPEVALEDTLRDVVAAARSAALHGEPAG